MIDYWPEIFRNSESFNDSKSFSFIISNGSRIDRQNNYCSNHFFKNKVEFSGKLIKQPQVKTLYKVSGSLKSCHSNIAKIEQSNVQKWIFLGFIFLSNSAFYENSRFQVYWSNTCYRICTQKKLHRVVQVSRV